MDQLTEYNDSKNIEKNVILEVNDENPDESSLTILTTRSEVNGLVTEKTEKCYGSKADFYLKAAEISGEQHSKMQFFRNDFTN